MKKWIVGSLVVASLATGGVTTANVANSSAYCAWDSNEQVQVQEVSVQENEPVPGYEEELTIDCTDYTVVENSME